MAKIAIDAGHGRYTPGKRCMKKLDKHETREWVLNDRVADELGRLLKSAGHTVKRMDDTDGSTDVSLAARVQKANAWGADFYISVHHNSGVNGSSGGGTEVYVSQGCQSKSKKAQSAIYKHAIKRGNLKGNRADGTRTANFYVIRYTDMPACLIECGFMDSKVDIKYILDPAWSKKIALGIAEGICEVFGGTVKAGGSGSSSTSKPAPGKTVAKKYIVNEDTRALQKAMNKSYDCNLEEDSSCGPATQKQIGKHYLYYRKNKLIKNVHAKWYQKQLNKKFKEMGRPERVDVDKIFGPDCDEKTRLYQKLKGLEVDGFAGLKTHLSLLK